MSVSTAALCDMTSRSTGKQCQQPERWLEHGVVGGRARDRRVCQVHGRFLERLGWTFVRELHPVAGYERKAESAR